MAAYKRPPDPLGHCQHRSTGAISTRYGCARGRLGALTLGQYGESLLLLLDVLRGRDMYDLECRGDHYGNGADVDGRRYRVITVGECEERFAVADDIDHP
ncbi:hypothetical protein Acsp02_75300 [Actinoplanes sp. NBRC 103695]|nr:hypothetical protein Acsp02_75300 [Actinoplanes sp. NBRC 103695]